MKKKPIKKAFPITAIPKFEPGTIYAGRCLVVDVFGIAWWVDAELQSITRA